VAAALFGAANRYIASSPGGQGKEVRMAETAQASTSGMSSIRINRLKSGYTYSVVVVADEDEQILQQAKQRAVDIVRELEQELVVAESEEEEDVAF
jgi:hypothetical protein